MPDGEIFALDARLLDAALVEEGPAGRVPYIDAGVWIELGALVAILGVASYDSFGNRLDESARRAEFGDAWLIPLPSDLRDALAALEAVDDVAARWAATDELGDWNEQDVHELVLDLRSLARAAQRDGIELWLWSSL